MSQVLTAEGAGFCLKVTNHAAGADGTHLGGSAEIGRGYSCTPST